MNKIFELTDLNEEQYEIATSILETIPKLMQKLPKDLYDRIYSISGKSGAGKSTLVSVILRELSKMEVNVKVTATTHRALANINNMLKGTNFQSSTIHSHLKCKIIEDYSSGTYTLQQASDAVVIPTDVLIVEESSMASAQLYEMIVAELYKGTIKMVIFLGDSAQLLPPEGSSFPIYEGLVECHNYDLKKVMRQAEESNILTIANYIRSFIETGEYIPFAKIVDYIKTFKDCDDIDILPRLDLFFNHYSSNDMSNSIIGAYKNVTVNMYNSKARLLNNNLTRMPFLVLGEKVIFNEAHIDGDVTLHANNEQVKIISLEECEDDNNDITYYKCVDEKGIGFKVLDKASQQVFDAKMKDISYKAKKAVGASKTALWKQYFNMKKEFQAVTYPYAGTVHKMQGISINTVYLDLNELIEATKYTSVETLYRLCYVGLTRAKHKVVFLVGV